MSAQSILVHEGYEITSDPARIDTRAVHAWLSKESYWARNIPYDVVKRSIEYSICFAILHETNLAGFARIISDRATYAYLGDVFVLPAHRGKGLSKWMMEHIKSHPELEGLRRWTLATADAHSLYAQFGFTPLKAPERWMEQHFPNLYAVPDGNV